MSFIVNINELLWSQLFLFVSHGPSDIKPSSRQILAFLCKIPSSFLNNSFPLVFFDIPFHSHHNSNVYQNQCVEKNETSLLVFKVVCRKQTFLSCYLWFSCRLSPHSFNCSHSCKTFSRVLYSILNYLRTFCHYRDLFVFTLLLNLNSQLNKKCFSIPFKDITLKKRYWFSKMTKTFR